MSKTTKSLFNIDDNGIAKPITVKQVEKILPENLTSDHFQQVDLFREKVIADGIHAVVTHAEKHGVSTGVTISDIPLLGNTTGNIHMDENYTVVGEVKTNNSEIMEAALLKTKELYESKNDNKEGK